ncbi:unnamed protein product [Paramecium sonneborni]|uniref:Uncharacterized protein n=1 Tax=Paramecium sonneborni TaxID=65129 RepID=A0A8S1P8J1_9CILI|nr:unnamed protein product [Paramecium sonneborni]
MSKQQQDKRPYSKMSLSNKEALKALVFQKGFKIKEAAQKLSINYASAKTIILQFRQRQIKTSIRYLSKKPCLIKKAQKIKQSINIISQTGGVKVNEKEYYLN